MTNKELKKLDGDLTIFLENFEQIAGVSFFTDETKLEKMTKEKLIGLIENQNTELIDFQTMIDNILGDFRDFVNKIRMLEINSRTKQPNRKIRKKLPKFPGE